MGERVKAGGVSRLLRLGFHLNIVLMSAALELATFLQRIKKANFLFSVWSLEVHLVVPGEWIPFGFYTVFFELNVFSVLPHTFRDSWDYRILILRLKLASFHWPTNLQCQISVFLLLKQLPTTCPFSIFQNLAGTWLSASSFPFAS